MAIHKKDPAAILDYSFDWGPYLTPLVDAIDTVTWLETGTLVIESESHTTTTATAFVSGGELDATETLTCRITTTGGRTDDRSISLKIVER